MRTLNRDRRRRAKLTVVDVELARLLTVFHDPILRTETKKALERGGEAFAAYVLGCSYVDVSAVGLYERFRREYRPRLSTQRRIDAYLAAASVAGRLLPKYWPESSASSSSLAPGLVGSRRPEEYSVVVTAKRIYFFVQPQSDA